MRFAAATASTATRGAYVLHVAGSAHPCVAATQGCNKVCKQEMVKRGKRMQEKSRKIDKVAGTVRRVWSSAKALVAHAMLHQTLHVYVSQEISPVQLRAYNGALYTSTVLLSNCCYC